jgi:SpoVK/Ycf46/Vps4 family AAA+-type ATPase
MLEYYETSDNMDGVGGLENLKGWLLQRRMAFTEKAREYGLPAPKGILTVGIPGCGKSLTAKATANAWELPLLRFDVGRVFAGLVGASEANMRNAIKVAEAMAPCVLWIDEIEKAFAGVSSSGSTDSGVTARVFGNLLTWMQEHKEMVFVFATANKVFDLPPELLRKGRFDEIFFIDLPDEEERLKIWEIHLKNKHRDPAKFDLKTLVTKSRDFTGAEIEQALISGMYSAFYKGTEVTDFHCEKALMDTVPLSRQMAEQIDKMRTWASNRAVRATAVKDEAVSKTRKQV